MKTPNTRYANAAITMARRFDEKAKPSGFKNSSKATRRFFFFGGKGPMTKRHAQRDFAPWDDEDFVGNVAQGARKARRSKWRKRGLGFGWMDGWMDGWCLMGGF